MLTRLRALVHCIETTLEVVGHAWKTDYNPTFGVDEWEEDNLRPAMQWLLVGGRG